ncbi:hypothetical protein [Rossellomorea aquimaris]|uniref:hypothetical protein n=1 Tax=Rossellomorea aquimaris TaxID=189382 RepID=UPI0005C869C4|nr:hypothetical protein [Rossellomorea aquimaris]
MLVQFCIEGFPILFHQQEFKDINQFFHMKECRTVLKFFSDEGTYIEGEINRTAFETVISLGEDENTVREQSLIIYIKVIDIEMAKRFLKTIVNIP